jgi:ribosomal protein S18 acetylase RimI-like enzyme
LNLVIPDIQLVEIFMKDLEMLRQISRRTFQQAFAALNTAENMESFLAEHFSGGKLLEEWSDPDSSFFFAKRNDQPIGYLKINRNQAQTVLPNEGGLEIERIYVDRELKGRGIGGLFIQKAVELAKEFGSKYVWLGVWEHNESAIRFYEKKGFRPYSHHIFKLGDDEQTDILMKRDMV